MMESSSLDTGNVVSSSVADSVELESGILI